MAEIICHNNNRFNMYNTISDGFRFVSSIDESQLRELIRIEQGEKGLENLQDRIDRAVKNGHSQQFGGSLDYFLCCNRAGENEARLSTEECIDRFLS